MLRRLRVCRLLSPAHRSGYLILVNVLAATGMPIKLPVGDLSGFLAGPDARKSR